MSQSSFRLGYAISKIIVVVAVLGVIVLPLSVLAQTYQSASTVNFAGIVDAVDPATNTVTVTVNWFYGVVGVANTTTGQKAVLPIAQRFCAGKTLTVQIASTTKIYSFLGKVITLSQVPAGAFFNASVIWKNGKATGKIINMSTVALAPPEPPTSFGIPQNLKLPTNAPQGSGIANVAGTITAVDPNSNTISAQVGWFYGVAANASNTNGVALAGHFCPGTSIPVMIDPSTSMLNFKGQTITLSQVPVGAFFNASIGWQGGVYTAKVLRMTTTPRPVEGRSIISPATPTTTTDDSTYCGFLPKMLGMCK